jgi:hypothetical protein
VANKLAVEGTDVVQMPTYIANIVELIKEIKNVYSNINKYIYIYIYTGSRD